jgi:hypothetical protein
MAALLSHREFRLITQPALFFPVLFVTLGLARPACAEEGHPSATSDREYLQYGLALAAEAVASPGGVCPPESDTPCILGSGGGVGVRVGYRARDPWFLGGAYEFSRHDSSNLLRLAILQQFRAEGRYYFDRGDRTTGFATAAGGFHIYGNEWGASTIGGLFSAGAGIEFELSPSTTVGCIATYRLLVSRRWVDSAGVERADQFLGFGFSHLIGFELTLEVREPIPRF